MLVAVDICSLRDLNTKQAAELLRGVNGSEVKLTLMKGTTRFCVTLVRECIDDYEKCNEKRHFGTSSFSPVSQPSQSKPYDDAAFYLFLQKQKIADELIPIVRPFAGKFVASSWPPGPGGLLAGRIADSRIAPHDHDSELRRP